jgi:prepilin-type N-terminal cleavage/methylation domain-containing protein
MESTMRQLRNSQGFTLIELMIVVVIIGILAAIAIPKFGSVANSAKQAEAEPILKQIHSLQGSFFAKNNAYGDASATGLPTVGYEVPTSLQNFVAPVITPAGTGATATYTACMAAETGSGLKSVTINQLGAITQGAGEAC